MTLEFLNLAFAVALVVIIWIVQLVHYPTFRFVDPSKFIAFHNFHTNNITYVVAPLMIAELIVAGLLVFKTSSAFTIVNIGLVVATWVLTFAISVPLHNKLAEAGFDEKVINQLCKTNWLRTGVWTLRFFAAVYAL